MSELRFRVESEYVFDSNVDDSFSVALNCTARFDAGEIVVPLGCCVHGWEHAQCDGSGCECLCLARRRASGDAK